MLSSVPDLDTKVALINTLVGVSEGKARASLRMSALHASAPTYGCLPTQIFLEVERARLTRMLARIAEDRGKPQEAADIMQEVAVETYGALSKEEKVAFVLEQVRLVLDRGDYARAQILAKKINTRTFAELDAAKDGEKKAPKRDSTIAPPEEVRMRRLVLVATGEQSLCASSRVCRERLRWRS